ncbi:MAG: DEAD/DEAH box helicase [Candidatus Deferrimicrobiota bacterium]
MGTVRMERVNLKKGPVRAALSRTHKPDGLDLDEWQRLLRKQFGERQKYRFANTGDHPFFSEFSVTNPESGKTYKVAIRGTSPFDNFCSCPDHDINHLGTCKHIEFVMSRLMKKKGAKRAFREGYLPPYSEVYLRYGLKREIRFKAGKDAPPDLLALAMEYFGPDGVLKEKHLLDFHRFAERAPRNNGHELRCYDDVMAYVAEHQDAHHRGEIISSRLKDGIDDPIFERILKTNLFPYQREGALFAATAGRCLIGDDMGLGKTVQALAAVELMAKWFGVEKVLIVSPTSLKYQWRSEIEKFSDRSIRVVEGLDQQRGAQYLQDSFYKMVNYELVARDLDKIRRWSPDLIILDEAQRIKNWKTRTAKCVKELESTFAIVLTGTPVENRIEELHSIMEFIDRRRLGPLFRFVDRHRIVDDGGKVVGYRDLQSVQESLKAVMIRRRKEDVLRQLPGRIDKNFLVPMTPEQRVLHDEQYDIVARLVAKWRRCRFLCEADQRRLQIALNAMRMAADNTYLVDKKTFHGPKLGELEIVLKEVVIENGEKAVIFSQWMRMTELVGQVLARIGIGFVHLNGSVPSKKRPELIRRFREDPDCKVFLSTDAGGVGLNLQAGSVVINMDVPWNPAVLEQRIGRVHRLGQRKAVRVFHFISAASIEERILDLLKFKKSLFAGVLDRDGDDVVMMEGSRLNRLMRSVETVASEIEKSAPVPGNGRGAEPGMESPGDAAGARKDSGKGMDPLRGLLVGGARFLMDLSRAVSQSAKGEATSGDRQPGGWIERDETTGKAYLKLPLPDPEVMNAMMSAFAGLAASFTPGPRVRR